MAEEMSENWAKQERPGCVTAYAILLWIGAAAALIFGLCGLSSLLGFAEEGAGLVAVVLIGLLLVLLAVNVATGIGLWQMKRWGWALVVVVQGLNVVGQVLSMAATLLTVATSGGDLFVGDPSVLCANLGGMAISGFILYWFVTNRALFNGGESYQKVIGPDGQEMLAPAKKKSSDTTMLLAVGGGLVLVFVLVCVAVIALLALMGPQVGNVFSQITFELENPTAGVILWLW